jgi:hypothetical protein
LFLRAPPGAKPSIQDEFAYLLQAKMLASGHLTYPSPPHPEFFEAAHVLVVPRYGAKYFPGHAAVLAPFVATGVPWLAPALLLGATLALLYVAARLSRIPWWAALFGVGIFLGSSEAMTIFGGYLSQTTSMTLVAAAIAAAAAFRNKPTLARCALLFTCAGACVLVRPFAGAALVAAATLVVAITRPRPLAQYAVAAAVPLVVAAAMAFAVCRATTGSWTTPPWALYARQYMPFDGPGVGPMRVDAPSRELPGHLAPLRDAFRASRERYTWSRVPVEAERRLDMVEGLAPSAIALPFAAAGIFCAPLLFAWTFAPLYFVLQLTFHVAMSTYFLETYPWLALAAAAGVAAVARFVGWLKRPWPAVVAPVIAAAGIWVLAQGFDNLKYELFRARVVQSPVARLEPVFEKLRRERALVFLHYPAGWSTNVDLGYNEPDLRKAEMIRALDLGDRNGELLRAFPGRPAYRLDLGTAELTQLR